MLNPVTEAFTENLRQLLPVEAFRPVEPRYLEETRGKYHGRAGLVIAPETVEEVSALVIACNGARVPLIPYGGGTGLVSGQLTEEFDAPVVLSLERMRTVREVDPAGGTMVVEAGVILQDVQAAAEAVGMIFPLSLASEGSARIGGCLATNAGGVNVIRYGNTRDLCLGLEAVLPTGEIVRRLSGLRKDNLGYDLRNLLIGSEGTLGVITAASLKLFPQPASRATALIQVASPTEALRLLDLARKHVGDSLSAFELISRQAIEFQIETMPDLRQPFDTVPEWLCLIDLGRSSGGSAEDLLMSLFETAVEAGLTEDGLISQSETQRREFWNLREMIPEANRRIGSISSHDISIPIARIPEFIEAAPKELAKIGDFRINVFGHLGDGNLHYNAYAPAGHMRADFVHLTDTIKRCVHDLTHEFGGSVSAEHGVGRLKVEDQDRYGDPGLLVAMRAIKAALDPNGIMNPGAVLARQDVTQ